MLWPEADWVGQRSRARYSMVLAAQEGRALQQTCVIRAWDLSKPLLFCPAMNTAMWKHPLTAQQVGQLKAFGYVEIPCVSKKLVCGDQGLGAMAEVETIVDKVKEVFFQHGGIQQS
ncbi:phosphopantothenoylcysteine decarboxylase isoform X5 [Peromyscus californicus insignis]|uniref:phosphopantothenoylcysteine decarboxylase isoform X5 n=1 Tax=Peromyscus californicus insignis TaxID=564181 RepID=UPI0022A7EBDD|nr:phosphopantothenoylcysteine decarboxylase isoform X5 [Peromyscus californicus insignis]